MTIGVAIIGAGIGAQHLTGFLALRERFAVRTICDIDTGRAQELANSVSGIKVETDIRVVLDDPQIDLIDVCLPPHLHFDICMAALDAGKLVICEKPLVPSLLEADRLVAKCQETGGSVFPVFQYRFGTGSAQLRALMDAGLAGKAFAATLETHWDRPASYYEVDWRGTWKGERGGAVLGHAIHIHDMLSAFLGPVARVHAELATRVNEIEVEDCAALSISMANGAPVTSSITLGCADNHSRLRIMFEGFTVESDHAAYSPARNRWHFVARAPHRQRDIDSIVHRVAYAKPGYTGMFEAIADKLEGKPAAPVTMEDGRNAIAFVTAVYASARSGMPATLPIADDHPLYAGWMPE